MKCGGWKKDLHDDRDLRLGHLLGAAPTEDLPDAANHDEHVQLPLPEQLQAESCVAHATTVAVQTAQRMRGELHPPLTSRLFVYWNARQYHGEQDQDAGTFLRTAMRTINKLGCCPESEWPYHLGLVNGKPSWSAYRAANETRVDFGYYRIDSFGDDRVRDVMRALANGNLVTFGAGISPAFDDWDGKAPMRSPEATAVKGGHAMMFSSYRKQDGRVVFRGPNWWGKSWGLDGWFEMDEEYVAWLGMADLWAISMDPNRKVAA